jgi:hypothetical protein
MPSVLNPKYARGSKRGGTLVVGRKKEGKKKEEEEEGHHILNISRAEDKIIIQAIECNYVI